MPKLPILKELWKYGSIQFGYISFFLLSFPAAAIIGVVMNVIHVNLLCYSLSTVMQRKDSVERRSIGVWNHIFFAMSFIALVTNIAILVFGSNGFREFVAEKLEQSYDSYTIVVILVIIEHIGFILKFGLSTLISHSPSWVKRRLEVETIKRSMDQERLKKRYALSKVKRSKAESRNEFAAMLVARGGQNTGNSGKLGVGLEDSLNDSRHLTLNEKTTLLNKHEPGKGRERLDGLIKEIKQKENAKSQFAGTDAAKGGLQEESPTDD